MTTKKFEQRKKNTLEIIDEMIDKSFAEGEKEGFEYGLRLLRVTLKEIEEYPDEDIKKETVEHLIEVFEDHLKEYF
ncbi:hypothetical protein [Cyanobacterium aponinum]|uniref:hypothetical protein n=1 Tax=Cyanobacterium aponinum TaxID=379064 RepID=UPI000C12BDDA|nr:hypothetical protein [Cyanobacterium aponinum]PHV61063.1 hypothetical protein CSQ80_17535 [Cyanobacterium aponinum IPPAS B-1201]